MKVDVLLGLQWGDEGKGKIVDVLTPQYDIIARFQGGPNAGHTLEFDGRKHVLHTIPSGIFREGKLNLIGNGVVIDPVTLQREIGEVEEHGVNVDERLLISRKAHLILPTHRLLDAANEQEKGKDKIGSTLRGIGPTYMDKTGRNGLRVGDIESPHFESRYHKLRDKHVAMLEQFDSFEFGVDDTEWLEAVAFLQTLKLIDSEHEMNRALKAGQRILAEGAQGTMLDIDFGTYPFVTSSNTTAGGAATGTGIGPTQITDVIGIVKAYTTRVGEGPLPSAMSPEMDEHVRALGGEFGATTGRPRRCGWFDAVLTRFASQVNGLTGIAVTKLDVLDTLDEVKIATAYRMPDGKTREFFPADTWSLAEIEPVYETMPGWNSSTCDVRRIEDLPPNARAYLDRIEELTNAPVRFVSVGTQRSQIIPVD